jgi:acyl-CoA thioester hydrolase
MDFMAKTFEIKIRVYYEDTDAGGIVYYANYLKYLERARTELIYSLGLKHKKIAEEYGFQIVVAHCDIAFKKPAHFEDHLVIKTELKNLSAVKLEMVQKVYKVDCWTTTTEEELLVDAKVTLACVNPQGKPKKMPPAASLLFKSCL